MRIVALDEVPNERGEPTMLGVIGSCRVHHPIQALVRSGRARLLGLPLSTYTHTPDEARQYLSHNLGLTPIPSAFQTYILGEDKISRIPTDVIEMVRRIDIFVVEICSAAQIRCGAYEFQMNYFVRNFVRGGGMSHLNWWRDVTAGSENIAEMAEEALAARANAAPSDEEILRTAQLISLDDAAFGRSMDALRALHPARWLFISHVNLSQRDDRLDPRREQSTRQLADYGAKSGVRVLDPTALVLAAGRENALGAGGRDLSHYNPDFELPMGEAISGEVAKVLDAPHTPAAPAASARLEILDDRDLTMLGRLADTERAPASTLRQFARFHAQAGRREVADVFWREALDADPADKAAAQAIAEHAMERGHADVATVYFQMAGRDAESLAELWPAIHDVEAIGRADLPAEKMARSRELVGAMRLFRRTGSVGGALHDLKRSLSERIEARQSAGDFAEAARVIAFMEKVGLVAGFGAESLRGGNFQKLAAALTQANKAHATARSEELAELYVALGGNLPLAWWVIGGKALRERRMEAAYDAYSRCVELRPDYAPFQFRAALVALRRRRYAEARTALERTLQRADPGDDRRIARSAGRLLPLVERRLARAAAGT